MQRIDINKLGRILITGGTGFVGSYLTKRKYGVPQLLKRKSISVKHKKFWVKETKQDKSIKKKLRNIKK